MKTIAYKPIIKSKMKDQETENRTSDYVCRECGLPFLTEAQKRRELITTAHKAKCGLCRKEKTVIHIRHYNYGNDI